MKKKTLSKASRLQSGTHWLKTLEAGLRPTVIARRYRKRYNVDHPTAIRDLIELGIVFPDGYYDMVLKTYNTNVAKKTAKRKERKMKLEDYDYDNDSDENFYYIAGYTEGGIPFGITWEEYEKEYKNYDEKPNNCINENFEDLPF